LGLFLVDPFFFFTDSSFLFTRFPFSPKARSRAGVCSQLLHIETRQPQVFSSAFFGVWATTVPSLLLVEPKKFLPLFPKNPPLVFLYHLPRHSSIFFLECLLPSPFPSICLPVAFFPPQTFTRGALVFLGPLPRLNFPSSCNRDTRPLGTIFFPVWSGSHNRASFFPSFFLVIPFFLWGPPFMEPRVWVGDHLIPLRNRAFLSLVGSLSSFFSNPLPDFWTTRTYLFPLPPSVQGSSPKSPPLPVSPHVEIE